MVTKFMRKCGRKAWDRFLEVFRVCSERAGKEQYVVPYLMAAFPGCTMEDMDEVRREMENRKMRPVQVQAFLPTPMTMAAAMYRTGLDPETGHGIYVERTPSGKRRQLSVIPGIRTGRRPEKRKGR